MHELAITQSLLEIAVRHAESAGGGRVTALHIIIGRLSSMIDDSVQFYWDLISVGTPCEGAKLHFQRIPATLQCLDCDTTYTLPAELAPCPACGSAHVQVRAGDEFRLESIDIEKDEPKHANQYPHRRTYPKRQ